MPLSLIVISYTLVFCRSELSMSFRVHKSILLRTFLLYKKSMIFIIRLSLKINYERLIKFIHLYERFW